MLKNYFERKEDNWIMKIINDLFFNADKTKLKTRLIKIGEKTCLIGIRDWSFYKIVNNIQLELHYAQMASDSVHNNGFNQYVSIRLSLSCYPIRNLALLQAKPYQHFTSVKQFQHPLPHRYSLYILQLEEALLNFSHHFCRSDCSRLHGSIPVCWWL